MLKRVENVRMCVCVCVREREREREKEGGRERDEGLRGRKQGRGREGDKSFGEEKNNQTIIRFFLFFLLY